MSVKKQKPLRKGWFFFAHWCLRIHNRFFNGISLKINLNFFEKPTKKHGEGGYIGVSSQDLSEAAIGR